MVTGMSRLPFLARMVIAAFYDVGDFVLGRVPVIGFLYDLFGGVLAVWLFGNVGYLVWLELLDVTDQFDALIPSMTTVGLISRLPIIRR